MKKFFNVKEVGIISGYFILLVGVIFLDYQPFIIFLSFLLEFEASVFVLAIVDYKDKNNESSVFNSVYLILSGTLLGIVQAAFIMLIACLLESKYSLLDQANDSIWLIPAIFIPALLLKLAALRNLKIDSDLVDKVRGEMMTQAVAFPIMILIGTLVYELIGNGSVKPTLITMIIGRLLVELWMHHFQKKK